MDAAAGYYQVGAMIPAGEDTIRGSGSISIEATTDTTFAGEYSFDESLASVMGRDHGRLDGTLRNGVFAIRFGGAASTGEFRPTDGSPTVLRGALTSVSFGAEESFPATLVRTREYLAGDYVFDLRYQRGSAIHGIVLGLLDGTEIDQSTLQLRGKLATYERREEGLAPYTLAGDLDEVDSNVTIGNDGEFSFTLPIGGGVSCTGDDYRTAGFLGTCDFGGIDSQIQFGLRRIVAPLRIANVPIAGRDTLGGARHLYDIFARAHRNQHAQTGLAVPRRTLGLGDFGFGDLPSLYDSIAHTYVPVIGTNILDTLHFQLPGRASRMAHDPSGGFLAATASEVYLIDEDERSVDLLLRRDTTTFQTTKLFGAPYTARSIIAFHDTVVTVDGETVDTLAIPGVAGSKPSFSSITHAAWTAGEGGVLWTITSRTEEDEEDGSEARWRELAKWDGSRWEVERLESLGGQGFPTSTNYYLSYRPFCPNPDRPTTELNRPGFVGGSIP